MRCASVRRWRGGSTGSPPARRAGIPVIWTGTWCGQRAATLGCSASWSRRSLAGSSTTARRSPRCTHSWTSARVTLSSAGPGFGCFYGTGLEVLLRSRHRHDHPRWHQHNVCVDTTAREAAVHEFRDSGGARARAAKGACRRPGTDGSSAGVGWHLMPGVEQRALPRAVLRHKTEAGIRLGARCAGWPRDGTMTR